MLLTLYSPFAKDFPLGEGLEGKEGRETAVRMQIKK